MARTNPAQSVPVVDPRLARTLWQWLALGALALALWPAARGAGGLLGWGPYWAVVAPLLALGVAYRRAWRARFTPAAAPATAHRRRSATPRGQAQRAVPAPRRALLRRVA